MRLLRGGAAGWDGVRFLVAGGLNTVLTLILYQFALFVAPDWVAYAVSWTVGLGLVIAFYPDRVFVGGRRDAGARVWLGATYAGLFAVGLIALRLLGSIGVPRRLSIFAVLVLTTGLNFLVGRLILRAERSS